MENPRHWRLNKQRYRLVGNFDGKPHFPPINLQIIEKENGNGKNVEKPTNQKQETVIYQSTEKIPV